MQLSYTSRTILDLAANILTEALIKTIDENHDPEEQVFARIVMVIYDFRNLMSEAQYSMAEYGQEMERLGASKAYTELYCASK